MTTPTLNPNVVKCGERTIRKPCRHCGRTENLWWGHDTSRSGTKWCNKCGQSRNFVLIEPDGSIHDCQGNGGNNDHEPGAENVPAVVTPSAPVNGAASSFGGVNVASNAADVAEELSKAIGATLGKLTASIDEPAVRRLIAEQHEQFRADMIETVGAVVSEKFAKSSMPTIVHVKRDGREAKELKGTHRRMPQVISALAEGEHVMLVGPMGTGKSTIAAQAAEALDLAFYFMPVGPQTSKSDILGYMTADGTYVPSLFRKAYEDGAVFLFDELDAAHPGVLTTINAALSNGHMAFPDGMVARHADTLILAAANTYGRGPDRQYVGRQAIDAATLDRFTVIEIDVDKTLEDALCYASGLDSVKVEKVLAYVRALRANAERQKMAVGFSPRASVGMCKLLHAGWNAKDAIESRVRRGLSDQDWSKVTTNVVTPSF
jgi:cobaltochelatase CobS